MFLLFVIPAVRPYHNKEKMLQKKRKSIRHLKLFSFFKIIA